MPATFVMVNWTLVKIPAWVGLVPPITPMSRLLAFVVKRTPPGRLVARKATGKSLVFCPAGFTTTLTALVLVLLPY